MARESAGAVYVTIDADSAPLIAKYAQAAAASQAAGQQIAKGLASGLQSGVSPILNAAGQAQAAVTQIAAAAVKAAPQIAQVTQAVTGVTAATNIATPAVVRTAAAVSGLGAASSHSVSEIQAVSGAIRTFDGNGGIRAAERFIVTTLGLGPAMQAIFPLVGALALSELLVNVSEKVFKLADNFLYLRDAEEEAKRVGEETADALEKSADHMRDLVVEVLREKGQLVLAAQESQFDLGQKFIHPPKLDESKLSGLASEDIEKVKAAFANVLPADLGDRIRQVNHDLSDMSELWVRAGKSADPLSQHFRSQAQVGVQLLGDALQFLKKKQDEFDAEQVAAQAKVGKAQEEENKKRLEAAKRFAADQRSAFKDGWDNILADQKAQHDVSKQEELTFRQNELAAARAGGSALAPIAIEVNRQVGTLSQEVRKEDIAGSTALAMAQVEYASRLRKQAISELEADGRLMGAAVEDITKKQDAAAAARKSAADIADRAGKQARQYLDVSASGSGEADKLRLQIAYEAQVVHSKQEELNYSRQLAEIEAQSLQLKVDAASQDVADAQAALQLNPSATQLLQLQQAITAQKQAQNALDNNALQTQVRLQNQARQNSLVGQIQGAVGKGPATILDAKNQVIAHTTASAIDGISSALGRAVQGGQRLGQIFSQLGRSILGEVVSGIAKIGLQMVTTALLGKSVGSAIAVAQVTSAAAVGAANAAAATAAIPIIGPALAPGVAAATFAEIMAFAPLASYAKGGFIAEDQIAQIHKGEFILTADQVSGRSGMPSLPDRGGGTSSHLLTASMVSNSNSNAMSIGAIHLHGVQNVEQFARRLPNVLKSRAPVFSPATR